MALGEAERGIDGRDRRPLSGRAHAHFGRKLHGEILHMRPRPTPGAPSGFRVRVGSNPPPSVPRRSGERGPCGAGLLSPPLTCDHGGIQQAWEAAMAKYLLVSFKTCP